MYRFKIKELAQERGITADDLARRSKVKFGTVRNLWQNRTQDPSFKTLIAIAKALNVPIENLAVEESEEEVAVVGGIDNQEMDGNNNGSK